MNPRSKSLLGQLLIEKKIITFEQLEIALAKQKQSGQLLGEVLINLGFIDEETVFLPVLADQFGVDFISLKNQNIAKEIINKIPAKFANHYKVIPVDFSNDTLIIATTKPLDTSLFDELGSVVNSKMETILAGEKDIKEAIRKYYGVGADTIEQMMDSVQPTKDSSAQVTEIDAVDTEASISKFLNQILLEAYRDRATDIHIEPFENELHIRYRVDGVLHDAKVPSNIKHFKDSINSRIKILSNLNIAEKRTPQDGRFKVRLGEVDLDLRVSFLPTPFGESVVIRILSSTKLLRYDDLGLVEREKKILDKLIKKPHGIIFVTGPTGSGKTTTLYSCLSTINTEDKKIITIEDPIEYQLKGVVQIQVNPQIGLTFAQGLRSMLRHDPDVMMVGEVRDFETAEIAIQVALTGHLVFSTLHTNDAASAVTRLLDMGVEPFLITSTVECFIAQRLVRLICPKCKKNVPITEEIAKSFDIQASLAKELYIYESKGCEQCNFSGYMGRSAIYEFLLINDNIRNLIMARTTAAQIKEQAVKDGMVTLLKAGWEKISAGLTSPQEVLRVTQQEEDVV